MLTHPGQLCAQLDQHLGCDALTLADEPEQDVLGPDVVMAELQRLTQAEFKHLLGTRSERDVSGWRLLALADDLLDLGAHSFQRDTQGLQRLGRDALALVNQSQQDVLGADVVVVEHPGFFLSQDDDPAGAVGKSLEHRLYLLSVTWRRGGTASLLITLVGRCRAVPSPDCPHPAEGRTWQYNIGRRWSISPVLPAVLIVSGR